MPGSPRSQQVDYDATRFYHCISRCVRRAFLCGEDPYTGQSFDHRKPWLLSRLRKVASALCIDVCAYAVLDNHFHVVLRVDPERAAGLSDEAVLRRYGTLFRAAAAEARQLPPTARAVRIAEFRERLASISWFMRAVNEFIARKANAEDEVTGRFWEGRFRSQALLDEGAVLTCMSYVDLNPVRAGICDSLDDAEHTSIQQRLREAGGRGRGRAAARGATGVPLVPLRGEGPGKGAALPMRFDDYVALLEWTGRAVGAKPGGRIRGAPPAVLGELGLESSGWLAMMKPDGMLGITALGSAERMQNEAARRERKWLRGKRRAAAAYASDA